MSIRPNFGVNIVSSSKYPSGIQEPIIADNIVISGNICATVVTGVTVLKGAVIRPSTVTREVIQTTSSSDEAILGVTFAPAIAGSEVCMVIGGEFQVLVTGVVTQGDFLASSATAGVAESTGTGGGTGDFAIAMNSDTDGGTKLVYARYKKAEVY